MSTDSEPTLYDWLGGGPALRRLTRVFYERHVSADPLLGPLFAGMSPDHPEKVADWLGEVFGGPSTYTDEHGGYAHMVREHLGRHLTEAQRARWAALLLVSADEVGLPADPEFRSAFVSYVEWGTRLALENSQPGARPPLTLPVPRWDWGTAGPPGRRTGALAGPPPVAQEPPVPPPGEPVSFAVHVRPLFRERDRRSMAFLLDLWSHADVVTHADAVLRRVAAGTMPCDGAWPAERVEVLRRWTEDGRQP